MHAPEHDWKVVAPWWRWPGLPARADTVAGRLTRPAIQKYETSDLVNQFIKDPQKCLKYVHDDVVPTYGKRYVPFRTIGPDKRAREIIDSNAPIETDPVDGKAKFAVKTRIRTMAGLRKLYLDTHKRFYLVVCQIHCDGPGFPRVAPDKVCEAGFVVRRRTTDAPAPAAQEAKAILKGIAKQRVRLWKLEAAIAPTLAPALKEGHRGGVEKAKLDAAVQRRTFVLALLEQEQRRLADWATKFKVAPTLQGWHKTADLDKVGQWQLVEEEPEALVVEEHSFPLYPLIPDRNDLRHAGQFGTIYFGLLPTGLADHDKEGRARFRQEEYYEVRCWVRRHKEPHDRGAPCRCPDKLFWSPPTEPYYLAGHNDLIGTSQRPVTIQLPDLKDLAADPRPRNGATFSKPAGSLAFSVGSDQKAQKQPFTKDLQICTLPIPLITIVAMFVLELFLPIVVFLFGLFWMLLLKFCIPPEIDIGGGLTAELQGQAGIALDPVTGRIDVSLTTDAGEDTFKLTEKWRGAPSPGGPVTASTTYVPELLRAQYPPPPLPSPPPPQSEAGKRLMEQFTTAAVVNWQMDYEAAGTSRIPSIMDGIEFEPRYEHP